MADGEGGSRRQVASEANRGRKPLPVVRCHHTSQIWCPKLMGIGSMAQKLKSGRESSSHAADEDAVVAATKLFVRVLHTMPPLPPPSL
ncbi:Os04g0300950 [Oryza sativa Japonica Group]|uniref:Os04g0300950 protein n=1 Tax=Oryza sativa subsp. japonica TaxID=39947 RepID=A0A0N7KIS9_ORYSJ|nr:Os04g0300950 [Oryza sativa Japonica Group]